MNVRLHYGISVTPEANLKQAHSKNIRLVEEAAGLMAQALAVRVTEPRIRIMCGLHSRATSVELPSGAFGKNL